MAEEGNYDDVADVVGRGGIPQTENKSIRRRRHRRKYQYRAQH